VKPPVKLYGITNCDTVKKARAWLTARGVQHEFHDYKKQGISPDVLAAWAATVGFDALLNRKGTTWRGLDTAAQASAVDAASALALMAQHTSLIKRPVVEHGALLLVGFDAAVWSRHWAG
jgi:arsenate reductase (glutaredoxin)